jgi:hypothetical protein
MITTMVPIVFERDVLPKIEQLAAMADALMGAVAQKKRYADDVLTDDHLAAGLLVRADGTPLTAGELATVRAIFAGLDAIRVAANTPPAEGQPSVGQLVRPFVR